MSSENFFAPNSASNVSDWEKNSNPFKSQENGKEKLTLKEIFNRDLNRSIYKICSEADLRFKVLLSNTVSGITSSTEFSPKATSSLNETSSNLSSLSSSTIKSKSHSPSTSKRSSIKRISKQRSNNSESFHFNTEIDNIDDSTSKQLTVVKILRLADLARRIENRQKCLIKDKFDSSDLKESYANGLKEGYRYGYSDNTNDELISNSEMTEKTNESTLNDWDEVILKNDKIIVPDNKKESGRMRGGYQDPQQSENRLIHKFDSEGSVCAEKITDISIEKPVQQVEHLRAIIKPEFPTKCTEDVNIRAFNDKFGITKHTYELGFTTNDLSATDRGQNYLHFFEKMLNSFDEVFAEGFKAGFTDGFITANINISIDATFSEDEKNYITQMRKCLKFYEGDIDNDIKKINARVEEMKKMLNISNDEFEEITYFIRKGVAKNILLKFSKNDYKYYTYVTNQDKENKKKVSIRDEKNARHSAFEKTKDILPQRSKERTFRYLTKHKINEFFQFLGAHLVADKPDDPISYLINLLEKCIDYRLNELNVPAPLLFKKKHVESIFCVLDPMATGYIHIQQYAHGMKALGIKIVDDVANFPPGEKVDKHIFLTNASRRLLSKFREMVGMDMVTAIPSTDGYQNIEA